MIIHGASRSTKVELLDSVQTVSKSPDAPTAIALEIQAGKLMALVWPSLPEATTDATPLEKRLSIIARIPGLTPSQGLLNSPPPRLILAAAILSELASVCTRSRPLMMSLSKASVQGRFESQLSEEFDL